MRFLIRLQIKSKSSITCMGFFLTRIRFFQQKPRSKKNLLNFIKNCLKVQRKCYRKWLTGREKKKDEKIKNNNLYAHITLEKGERSELANVAGQLM